MEREFGRSTVTVRPLEKSDAAAFWRVRLRALQGHPDAFGESASHWRDLPMEQVEARLHNPASPDNLVMGAFLSVERGAAPTLVGTVGFARSGGEKTQHKGVIWGVYTAPEVRSTGVGKGLMQAMIAHLRTLSGLEQVSLAVVTTNTAARSLYLSLGFQLYGLERHATYVDGHYNDEGLMVLFLSQGGSKNG